MVPPSELSGNKFPFCRSSKSIDRLTPDAYRLANPKIASDPDGRSVSARREQAATLQESGRIGRKATRWSLGPRLRGFGISLCARVEIRIEKIGCRSGASPSEGLATSGREHPLTQSELEAVIDLAVELGVIEQPTPPSHRNERGAIIFSNFASLPTRAMMDCRRNHRGAHRPNIG
jgi:hypothetical protein